MNCLFLSALSHPELRAFARRSGYSLVFLRPTPGFEWETAAHPDSRLAVLDDRLFSFPQGVDARCYPASCMLNGLVMDDYFIHNLAYTYPPLLKAAQESRRKPIHVRQGYCRCAALKVDGHSLITADRGLYKSLSQKTDLELLLVREHPCLLDRHTGFLGGAAGRLGSVLLFHGDLTEHPDHKKIRAFIEKRGYALKWFPFPLRDIGGWVAFRFAGADAASAWLGQEKGQFFSGK